MVKQCICYVLNFSSKIIAITVQKKNNSNNNNIEFMFSTQNRKYNRNGKR